MRLCDFVNVYAVGRDIEDSSVKQLGFAVTSLDRFFGDAVQLEGLSDGLINRWIAARLAAGRARKTVSVQRAAVLTLWKEAHLSGLAPPLGRVRMVRIDSPIVETWWPAEFRALIEQASIARGAFECGIPRRLLLPAFYLAKYDSGLRLSDVLKLRSSSLLSQGRFIFRQSKTREPVPIEFSETATAAISATHPERREMIFPLKPKQVWRWTRRLCRRAGLRGSPKWVRRFGATRCEQQQPGSAMAYLGHKTPGLAYKNYVDLRQVATSRPLPPPV